MGSSSQGARTYRICDRGRRSRNGPAGGRLHHNTAETATSCHLYIERTSMCMACCSLQVVIVIVVVVVVVVVQAASSAIFSIFMIFSKFPLPEIA